MNRAEFYKLFAAENDMTHCKAMKLCDTVFDLLTRCIKENDRVYIKGFGSFKKIMTKPRRIPNLNGEGTIELPAFEKVIFEPYHGAPIRK